MSARILVFAGSVRSGSINVKLAQTLTDTLVTKGAEAEHISLNDYPMPIFNGDIDVPDNAMKLAERFSHCDGLVIVSPEYNSSLTPLLKNAIDWVSVTKNPDDESFGPYKHKICFLASCSPGAIGGLRGLYTLRTVMMNVGAEIITSQLAVGNAASAFSEQGGLAEPRLQSIMENGLDELLLAIKRVKAVPPGEINA